MADGSVTKITIDELVEATSTGVLRALEARRIGAEFTKNNGFFVKIDLTMGGFPGPINWAGGGIQNLAKPGG